MSKKRTKAQRKQHNKKLKAKSRARTAARSKRKAQMVQVATETDNLLKDQLAKFKETFGREPTETDPIFFDPDITDTPTAMDRDKLNATMAAAAKETGMPPELVYAIEKTGIVLGKFNEHMYSNEDKLAWASAIEEYQAQQEG